MYIPILLKCIPECEWDGCTHSISKKRKNALQGETDAISSEEGV